MSQPTFMEILASWEGNPVITENERAISAIYCALSEVVKEMPHTVTYELQHIVKDCIKCRLEAILGKEPKG